MVSTHEIQYYDSELLLGQLRSTLHTLRERHSVVLTELLQCFESHQLGNATCYGSLHRSIKKLELLKQVNDIELDLDSKRLELKRYDMEEKRIEKELSQCRVKS